MTKDEIMEMARQATGMFTELPMMDAWIFDDKSLESFAKLVAQHERERIKQANAPEIERVNAHIKQLEDAVLAEREEVERLRALCYEMQSELYAYRASKHLKDVTEHIRTKGLT